MLLFLFFRFLLAPFIITTNILILYHDSIRININIFEVDVTNDRSYLTSNCIFVECELTGIPIAKPAV